MFWNKDCIFVTNGSNNGRFIKQFLSSEEAYTGALVSYRKLFKQGSAISLTPKSGVPRYIRNGARAILRWRVILIYGFLSEEFFGTVKGTKLKGGLKNKCLTLNK